MRRSRDQRLWGGRRGAPGLSLILAAGLFAAIARAEAAEPFGASGQWLPQPESLARNLKARPVGPRLDQPGEERAEIGAVLFRSPLILGPVARRMGLSCDACHGNGAATRGFFLSGLSAAPGTVDLTSDAFAPGNDDGRFNPIVIPSLRGNPHTAPYGHRGAFPTARAFVRHVIVDEFAGDEPDTATLDALAAFLSRLDFPANQSLDGAGRLAASASAAARRGEAVFHRPFPGRAELSCAACHVPARGFTDGRRHDVGTGGAIDTPSLRDRTGAAAHFHDGREETLAGAVAHFERLYALSLSAGDRLDLLAYLRLVGDEDAEREPVTLASELERHRRGLTALGEAIAGGNGALAEIIAATLRLELGALAERFVEAEHQAARDGLAAWSRRLAAIGDAALAGDRARAERGLATHRAALPAGIALLRAAAPTSLFDAERLDQALAARGQR